MTKEETLSVDHDSWFRALVQEAIDDPCPGIPQDVVRQEVLAIIHRIAAGTARQ